MTTFTADRHPDSTRETVHELHLEYQLHRARLDKAIAEAERTYARLVRRLAVLNHESTRAGDRLRRPGFVHTATAPVTERTRAQRSSATISVAHATAS